MWTGVPSMPHTRHSETFTTRVVSKKLSLFPKCLRLQLITNSLQRKGWQWQCCNFSMIIIRAQYMLLCLCFIRSVVWFNLYITHYRLHGTSLPRLSRKHKQCFCYFRSVVRFYVFIKHYRLDWPSLPCLSSIRRSVNV